MLGIFAVKREIAPAEVEKGLRMYVVDGLCVMTQMTLQGGIFLSAFALALGATQRQVGFIASIGFISQIAQLLGLFLVQKTRRRKVICVIDAAISRLLWIPVVLLPVFVTRGVWALLALLFLISIFAAIPGPAWNSWMRDFIPQDRLGQVNGRRIFMGTAFAMLATLLGGYFLDWWQEAVPGATLFGYSILFAVGVPFSLVALVAGAKIPEPEMEVSAPFRMRELLSAPFKDGNFRRLMLFLAALTFAINMVAPFYLVYMLQRIHLSLFGITVLSVINQLVTIFFLRIWGKLADMYSNKSVLAVCCPIFMLAVLAWCFTTTPEPHRLSLPLLFVIHVCSGMAVAGITIGTQNISLKLSPKGMAHGYLTVTGLCAALAGALGPIAGGLLADALAEVEFNVPVVLTVSGTRYAMPILNLKALDFLFLVAFLVGIASAYLLSRVREDGEREQRVVVDGLLDSVMLPIRSLSFISGMRRLAALPLAELLRKRQRKRESEEE